MNITFYKKLAQHFRETIEDIDLSNAAGFLPSFPDGCCPWASRFIGQFLLDEYNLSPEHIYANSHADYDGGGHEWIEVENIIIDITADQFNKYNSQLSKIIVCEVGGSKWHSEWGRIERDSSSFDGFLKYDEIAINDKKIKYTDVYKMICKKVKERLTK